MSPCIQTALLVAASALMSMPPPALVMPEAAVTTAVSQSVHACKGWGSCCVDGTMKTTFKVTLNGDGTAQVQARLKAMGVHGDCFNVHGALASTATVPVETAWGFGGYLSCSSPDVYAPAYTIGTIHADGTVTDVGVSLGLFSTDPG